MMRSLLPVIARSLERTMSDFSIHSSCHRCTRGGPATFLVSHSSEASTFAEDERTSAGDCGVGSKCNAMHGCKPARPTISALRGSQGTLKGVTKRDSARSQHATSSANAAPC
eukprot:6212473-Pleurochrysis_carterae.AAC.2